MATDRRAALEQATAAAQELACRRARNSLLAFTAWTFPGYLVSWHHTLIASVVQRAAETAGGRVIVCVPPRRGKTELASRRLAAWYLGRHPDHEVISCSHSLDLARTVALDVKGIMLQPRYRATFPGVEVGGTSGKRRDDPEMGAGDHFSIRRHRGGYLARGVGGAIAGHGAHLLVIDDPHRSAADARSLTCRESVWTWYTREARTRLAPGGSVVLMMTRRHLDDLAGRLLRLAAEDATQEQWQLVRLPEILDCPPVAGDPRAQGDALWPIRYPAEESAALKALDPEGFSAEYQQHPVQPGGAIVRVEWLTRHWDRVPRPSDAEWIQAWDLRAGGQGSNTSWVVGQVWCRPHGGIDCYLVDQVRGRWEIDETIEQIKALSKRWPAALRKRIEAKADGRAVARLLSGTLPGIDMAEPAGGKEDRLRAVLPLFSSGHVVLPPKATDWLAEWKDELTTFPGGQHDDQVDATSLALADWAQRSAEPIRVETVARVRSVGW